MSLTEQVHPFEFLISEGEGSISRQEVTVKSGASLKAGAVLGKITAGAATAAARDGNTGTGAMGAVTTGISVIPGQYLLEMIDAVANAGVFRLTDPNGKVVAEGTVGAAFTSAHLNFTLADATDFVVGDSFIITVAAGSGKYKLVTSDAVDGSAVACAILGAAIDATSADKTGVAIVRLAEVNKASLDFGALDAGQIAIAIAQLASVAGGPIIVRSAL